MREAIKRIIHAGVKAPSGDNCQPWRFAVNESFIDLHLLPDRDRSLYSWRNLSSYIAHGAALENMSIAATAERLSPTAELFPDTDNPLHTARITLARSSVRPNPLHTAIESRCTNRKAFRNSPLTDSQRNLLRNAGGAAMTLIEDPTQRSVFASAAAYNEKVLFENKHMHEFFFRHMVWTPQDSALRTGFPVGALELPPPVRALWPAFRHWPVMATLASVGFANAIVFGNTPIYASGAALCTFFLNDRTPEEYVNIGRTLERVWLTATQSGLHAQMLTGIPLLMGRVEAGGEGLSNSHKRIITTQYLRMRDALGDNRIIAFALRVGVADPPSARTLRATPEISHLT